MGKWRERNIGGGTCGGQEKGERKREKNGEGGLCAQPRESSNLVGSRLLLCCRRMAFLVVGRGVVQEGDHKCDSIAHLEVPLKVNPAGIRQSEVTCAQWDISRVLMHTREATALPARNTVT